MNSPAKKKNTLFLNVAFVAVGAVILVFFLRAPEVTTPRLPHDEIHDPFRPMKKREADKQCESCHYPQGEAPMPAVHPITTERCLFCHRRDD
ncbi:MAG: hypothetical protein H8E79_03085 [Desulfobulbaceae bacterium]|uniref:Cytochrome C n=1 Tax=Candidatus Desulfatifera sulfidica TaxID=2841691 RepID=A0A8J6N7H4_9BACT|nr:hypothetical protein [Candidatus Desulfatifera sulfidica]